MKKLFSFLIAIALISISFFPSCESTTEPDSTTGTIEGTALLQGESDHSSITVIVEEASDRGKSVSTGLSANVTTDGSYSISNVPPGKYTVYSVSSIGLSAFMENVEVEAGKTVIVNLTLVPTGSIKGILLPFHEDTLAGPVNLSGLLIYIPGTSYSAASDSAGDFIISNIPVGSYTIRVNLLTDIIGEATGIIVTAGDTVSAPAIQLEKSLFGIDRRIDPRILPKLIYSIPYNGQVGNDGLGNEERFIRLIFNKYMDRNSISRAFSIDHPEVIYDDSLWLYTEVLYEFRLYFTGWNNYQQGFRIGETYTVTVDTIAKDITGLHLIQPEVISFTPEPIFKLTRTFPSDGDTINIDYQGIVIYFNSYPDSNLFKQSFSESPQFSWEFSAGYCWSPNSCSAGVRILENLQPNTRYTITIDQSMADFEGNTLPESYTWSFITEN